MSRFYALSTRPWVEDPGSKSGTGGSGHWGLPPGTIGSIDLAPVGGTSHVFVTSDAPFDPADVAAAIGGGARLDSHVPTADEAAAWETLVGVTAQPGWTLLDLLWATLTTEADPDGLTRAKPIMPTHQGVLELHLGGHSLIRAEKLPANPTAHPAWPKIQRVLHNDYRAIQARDRTLARKWLGAQGAKYRLSPEATRDLLVPADLPRELPLRPTTTITDDFNRADQSGFGTSSEGWSWRTVRGAWEIRSNRAFNWGSSWNVERADFDLSSDDHKVSAEVEWPSVEPDHRIFAVAGRMNDAGGDMQAQVGYIADADQSGNELRLSRWGTTSTFDQVEIATWAHTIALDTVYSIELECDGSNVTIRFNNGAFVETRTDTNITGNLRTGVWSVHGDGYLDNFAATDLLAETPLVTVRSEAMGTGEALLPVRGRTRARIEGFDVGQAVQRLRAIARRQDEAVALTGMSAFARALSRLRLEAGGITESTMSKVEALAEAVVRVLAEAVAMAEAVARPRRLARVRAELVGMADAVARIGGLVSAAVPSVTDRIRMRIGAASRLSVGPSGRMNVPPARR